MRSRCAAFTLVELLVVIGIIAVLLAILLPSVSRARGHANQIACANNEKQIAAAIFMYVNDNHGQLPLIISPFPPNQTPFEAIYMILDSTVDFENGVLWPYVAPDVDTRQKIFNCPSDPDPKYVDPRQLAPGYSSTLRNFSYCLTYELDKCSAGAALLSGSAIHGLAGVHAMPVTMVRHPDQKFLVIEDYAPGTISNPADVYLANAGGILANLTSRHSGMANIAFFDGHCEPFDPATFSGLTTDAQIQLVYNYWVNVFE